MSKMAFEMLSALQRDTGWGGTVLLGSGLHFEDGVASLVVVVVTVTPIRVVED